MERGAGGGQQPYHHAHTYMTASDEYTGQSSFDNPATKKKPPKLKAINRSISMAIDNYEGAAGGGIEDSSLIIEQPLIHRAASPVAIRSAPPPQTLALPTALHHGGGGGGGSGAVSPALSARQQQQRMHSFQHLASSARQYSQQQQHHSSSASSPTSHAVSPVLGGGARQTQHQQQHPDIYLVSSGSLGEDMAVGTTGVGGSSSPIQFIDDYMLPPTHGRHAATHPLKKSMFRRSDTIDIHPASTFQMKKTHSFHAPTDSGPLVDPLLLSAIGAQTPSASSSRRTSSVRGNFLMPGHASTKDLSRSPSPSRRGCRSHRSLHEPSRRPSGKPDTVTESQLRHPSLNDDLIDPNDARSLLMPQATLSLENELFAESRSRSNSHTKMDDVGTTDVTLHPRSAGIRKTSGSFEEAIVSSTSHPVAATSSLKKRDHPHTSRQHSTHSLELDGRPSTSAAAAAAAASTHSSLHLHGAAAAATAAYHFKRGAQHGRSLYLSPNALDELQVHHRPTVLAAAAAFQGTNASASSLKQAKALHSASMRLKTYRETLSASKKSKSFIADGTYPPPINVATNEFVELTSPHRRNSGRPLTSATGATGATTIEDIKRSPRPVSLSSAASSAAATSAFIEEKRPSFERKPSLTYELSDAAFEQVLRPFHHKATGGMARKPSLAGSHKPPLKKKSLSDETDEDEESDRKRKRIVCIVMTVFLCLVCASVFVVIMTLTHSSGQTHHHHLTTKKTYSYNREVPVHYNGNVFMFTYSLQIFMVM
uniref:Uncharacterized protein n=1 Tax=Glossina austeni TaxID=7395 RepID=A0A1A9V0Q6_GLOAU